MLGRNEVTTQADFAGVSKDHERALLVHSIFYTIQGEGPDAGLPAVFVRLAKCNLRCYFCDTEFDKGEPMTVREIIRYIANVAAVLGPPALPPSLIVVTGGEPFLQRHLSRLVHLLNCDGISVSFETAGTVWDPSFETMVACKLNKVICSPKTPLINTELVPYVSAFKYVVAVGRVSEQDGLPNCSTQNPEEARWVKIYRPPANHRAPIYVSPMDEGDAEKNDKNRKLAALICMQYGYRLSLQMHKIIGLP